MFFRRRKPDARLSGLLDQADRALEEQNPQQALELADQALALDPANPGALRLRAEALAGLGRLEDAREAYARALKRNPRDRQTLQGAACLLVYDFGEEREALEDAVALCERGLKDARRDGDEQAVIDFLLLLGAAHNGLGQCERALAALDEAAGLAPQDVDVALERSVSLFELCRFQEAREELRRTLSLDSQEPWAHHYLGLIAEREGDERAAQRWFAKARALGPDEIPKPVVLSPKAFESAVEDALVRLPPKVQSYLSNVTIAVEKLPSEADLLANHPPLSPSILGLFRGTPLTEQSVSDPWSHFPSAILLFQNNLQRFAADREELIEQIGVTLVHEVGHFLGLSEEELYQRGLD